MKKMFLAIGAFGLLLSCNTPKTITSTETEIRDLDTMVISAPRVVQAPENYSLPKYNPSATRSHDLLHTKLDVKFNWEKEQVLGKATLVLTPYFYDTDKVTLDAKGFEFHEVRYADSDTPLGYDYDGRQIEIDLGKTLSRKDTFTLFIDYTATPRADGGSAAISSDKGLYFINPRGEDPDKPQQIWTQGETESNSRWFPTIDKPNERTTQEMLITVEDRFETLSNGVLVSSTNNKDGSRTDYYKMDLPHAPYLFMIAVGDFAVVKDEWEGIPLEYYVEHEYKDYAEKIFPYTPEMLTYFSDLLNVKYPWPKYAQVVVRDYVSGAMENTTAVLFGEFIQRSEAALADDDDLNEKIVAHEMFHHWFGDLVTTESWANLTLNEGFANYSEYLWFEHKHGRDEADYHLLGEQNGYLASAQNGIHDLIYFGYDDKEQMFDAHSYNKGGLVLHMLRNYVGDDAFFRSLEYYLKKNAFSDVEGHKLRLAFEEVTGQDLNWFFNQWFYDKGHPELDISYHYDPKSQTASVTVEQLQNPDKMPAIFQLPAAIDIYLGPDEVIRKNVLVNQRKQTFEFEVPTAPELINFDADKVLLAEKHEYKTAEEYKFQYRHAPTFMDRFEAMEALLFEKEADTEAIFEAALEDPFWVLRIKAMNRANTEDEAVLATLENLAKNDSKPQVRAAALEALAATQNAKYTTLAENSLKHEKSLMVTAAALRALQQLDETTALAEAKKLESSDQPQILNAIADIYATAGKMDNLSFFENNWHKIEGFSVISFMGTYADLAIQGDQEAILSSAEKLKVQAMDMEDSGWKRFAATKAINSLHESVSKMAQTAKRDDAQTAFTELNTRLVQMIASIKAAETDPQLKMLYKNFPTKTAQP